jgi:phage-related protein
MSMLERFFTMIKRPGKLPQETASINSGTSERGDRATPESKLTYLYRMMWVDPDLRAAILDIREMDRLDGRVKRIHGRIARDTIKGGLVMQQSGSSAVIAREWNEYQRRLQLNRVEKLKSDARGLVMEGNLPLQWVLDDDQNVVSGVRMPSETIVPNVAASGRFNDVAKAYTQFDVTTGRPVAVFPLWQLFVARFDPDNFDDLGSLGRPFLDASRTTWQKLGMTEEDLVIRRRMRAPLRMVHVLKGASEPDVNTYRAQVEKDQAEGSTTDYFMNREGGVTAVQGDSNLDHMKDIVHLLDSFFAGSPIPKGMAGYTDGMARDILEDLKRDYYDEIDVLQDTLSFGYDAGFRLQLLLKGINPDAEDFKITFAERRTETPSQTADRALKLKALQLPQGMVWEELGFDPAYVEKRRTAEAKLYAPYPEDEDAEGGDPEVSITPGNERKGGSGTSITNA